MRSRIAVALAVALVTSVLVAVAIEEPTTAWTRDPRRIAGVDRYETAAALSKATYPVDLPAVVLASGAAFADGLVGGPLAARLGGSVLLTDPLALPAATATELTRLSPANVVVLGGPQAVSDSVLAEVATLTGVTPQRLAGATRYDTAAAVAASFPSPTPIVFVASGTSFPDALAGGAAAAAAGAPLLLVDPLAVPAPTSAELARLAPAEIVVLGGPGAVGDDVVAHLASSAPVRRLAGADRYATAVAVARDRFPLATQALLATGSSFPDALSAAPVAARLGAPVLFTNLDCAPDATVDLLQEYHWPDLTVVGGTAAVSDQALDVVPCTTVPDGVVAPGVRLDSYTLPGPRVANVLSVDRSAGMDIRPTLATSRLGSRRTTSSIARRWNAVAAVNGDFFLPSGEPVHAFAKDGRILKSPGFIEIMVGFSRTSADVGYQGRPDIAMTLTSLDDGATVPLDRVNDGAPGPLETAMFTAESSGVKVPVEGSCHAVLGATDVVPVEQAAGVRQRYAVVSRGCGEPPKPTAGQDVVVATAGSTGAGFVSGLRVGSTVEVQWRLHPAWTDLVEASGGNLTLVRDGATSIEVVEGTEPFFQERAPRTAIAWLADGTTLLVTVDGRRSGYSIGMTARELADFLVSLGAVQAANLDGGGSTAMVVDGVLANRPSDATGERAVGTALVVVPAGQTAAAGTTGPFARFDELLHEVAGEMADEVVGAGLVQGRRAGLVDPASDVASVGGYAAALRERGVVLPAEMLEAAKTWEAVDTAT